MNDDRYTHLVIIAPPRLEEHFRYFTIILLYFSAVRISMWIIN